MILDLLQSDGFDPKRTANTDGGEYHCPCPLCGGKDRLAAWSETDKWWCRQCNKGGDVIQYLRDVRGMEYPAAAAFVGKPVEDKIIKPAFKAKPPKKVNQDMADKYHAAITDAAHAYLASRGLTPDDAKRFKLGLYVDKVGSWLSIPHYQGGELRNIKFRSLPPAGKTFRRIQDAESVLFNADALVGAREAIVCEGELDAITLSCGGHDVVVSGTTGAAAFDPTWIDALAHLDKVYLCYDGDESGQKGARALGKRLGFNRVYNIELPEDMDANEYVMANGIDAFNVLKDRARQYDLPGVVSFEDALDLLEIDYERTKDNPGVMTPWPVLNDISRGFNPGDLIIVSAPPKIGKTTFCLEISRHMANADEGVLFYCLEMRPERLARKLIQAQYHLTDVRPTDIIRAREEYGSMGMPLYFGHSFKKLNLEVVLNIIREAIKRYDLKMVVFDNLHFIIRSVSNVNEELGQAVQGFKLLAEEMEIPIIAIAQPRKRDASQPDRIMTAEDIKYSNAVHADCDQMIILYRKRVATKAGDIGGGELAKEALAPLTLVRVEAHRYGPGGECTLYFHGAESRFSESEPGQTGIPF